MTGRIVKNFPSCRECEGSIGAGARGREPWQEEVVAVVRLGGLAAARHVVAHL